MAFPHPSPPARVLLLLVRGYRLLLSPWLGSSCRFEPTCSAYALGALRQHGARRGGWLTLRRLGRCHPWCAGGYDPVPEPPARLFTSLLEQPGSAVDPSPDGRSGGVPSGLPRHRKRSV